jgi:hypothetical protein
MFPPNHMGPLILTAGVVVASMHLGMGPHTMSAISITRDCCDQIPIALLAPVSVRQEMTLTTPFLL